MFVNLEMANVDQVIAKCVDDIWSEYDTDNNNYLDRTECHRFILTTITEFAGPEAAGKVSEADFIEAFNFFDIDRNGRIEKSEMVRFIRKVAGLSLG